MKHIRKLFRSLFKAEEREAQRLFDGFYIPSCVDERIADIVRVSCGLQGG